MDNIQEIMEEIVHSNEKSMLATIIQVDGSAYRKEGTTMLFCESGRQIGVLSAGCLETNLAAQADRLLRKADVHSQAFVYDTSSEDDLSWGRGAGCNGIIHILLEKVDQQLRENLRNVKQHLDCGTPITAAKVLNEDSSVARTVYLTPSRYHSSPVPFWMGAGQKAKCGIHCIQGLESKVYIHHFLPKPRLFLFGAGPDARPLASMAHQTGFSVKIWDWRSAYCNQNDFPNADLFLTGSIPEALGQLAFIPGDSVIMMTHEFQKDKELLHSLLGYQQISYLGILGPRKRTSRLLDGGMIPERLHSPVGLDIGADGPEEISVSVLADLIRTQRIVSNEKRCTFEQTRDHWDISGSRKQPKVWEK